MPSPVDRDAGMVEKPPIMLGWHQFPIVDWLQQCLGCYVLINNDVMELGKQVVRETDSDNDFVCVKVGIGIGTDSLALEHLFTPDAIAEIPA